MVKQIIKLIKTRSQKKENNLQMKKIKIWALGIGNATVK